MKLDEIRRMVADIEALRDDPESAHSEEDQLRSAFIAHVAQSGPPKLAEMAREVLKTDNIKFPRWCA